MPESRKHEISVRVGIPVNAPQQHESDLCRSAKSETHKESKGRASFTRWENESVLHIHRMEKSIFCTETTDCPVLGSNFEGVEISHIITVNPTIDIDRQKAGQARKGLSFRSADQYHARNKAVIRGISRNYSRPLLFHPPASGARDESALLVDEVKNWSQVFVAPTTMPALYHPRWRRPGMLCYNDFVPLSGICCSFLLSILVFIASVYRLRLACSLSPRALFLLHTRYFRSIHLSCSLSSRLIFFCSLFAFTFESFQSFSTRDL